ncbi:MAG: TolC family protein [Syntrophobacteraceae bacterium]
MKTTSWNMRKLRVVLIVFAFSLCFVEGLRAEKLQTIGLEDLISRALETSPEIKQAGQDILSAESDLAQACAGRLPQLDVTAVVGPVNDAKEPVVISSQKQNGRITGYIHDRDEDGIGIFGRLDFTFIQPIYTFGKISNRKDAAERGVDAQKAAMVKKRGEIIFNVKQLYFGLIVAGQGKNAANDAESFFRDARTRIERLLKLNATNVEPSDLYRLDAFEAQVDQFRAKAESGRRMAYLALKKAVGYPSDQDFELDVQELPKDTRALDSRDEYIKKAMGQRPEFEQLKAGIEAQKSMVAATKADLYPSFFAAAVGSFAGAPGRNGLDNSYFNDEFNHAGAGIIVGSQWHFDFGIGRGRINKEAAAYEKLLAIKEYAEANIPLEVAKYYEDVLENQASYQAFEKAAIAARKWVVSSFTNFDMGVGTSKDMFDAIDRYGKNQGEYLLALYNYHVALSGLSYAVGEYGSGKP